MAIIEVKPSDPNFAEYRETIEAIRRAQQRRDENSDGGTTLSASDRDLFHSSHYAVVYPLKVIDGTKTSFPPSKAPGDGYVSGAQTSFSVTFPCNSGAYNRQSTLFVDDAEQLHIEQHFGVRDVGVHTTFCAGAISIPKPNDLHAPLAVIVTDLNQDGLSDFATLAPNGAIRVFLNTGEVMDQPNRPVVNIFQT